MTGIKRAFTPKSTPGEIKSKMPETVSLLPNEILYIESNDKEVTVYATEARRFRNKTGISQWANLLGDNFLRIHRSYLVNTAYAKLASSDTVTVDTAELPISRKYKDAVQTILV